jgi:hypothetical protein
MLLSTYGGTFVWAYMIVGRAEGCAHMYNSAGCSGHEKHCGRRWDLGKVIDGPGCHTGKSKIDDIW